MKTLMSIVKSSALLLVVMIVLVSVMPVAAALPVEGESAQTLTAAAIIPGADIQLSSEGALSPDIEINSAGTFVALTYYRDNGWVHLKSATLSDGWLTTKALGQGSDSQLSFDPTTLNRVYVVWANSDNSAIEYARCTLSATNSPSCVTGVVETTSTSSETVENPDVVVDSSGNVHVAWTGTNGSVETVKTSWSTNQGASWATNPVVLASGADNFRRPALAFANGVLHLAYVRENTANPPQGVLIEVRRATNLTNHNWSAAKTFGPGSGVFSGYNSVNFPTIVANGTKVYLAWQGHSANNAGVNEQFALMKSESADGGQNWPSPVRYITSDASATSIDTDPLKNSRSSFFGSVVPIQEDGLRPSLVISGTSYAAVWQQRPDEGCPEPGSGNGTSEIYYSYKGSSWSGPDTVADNVNQYSIDPDLAVNPTNQERHFVFMKDDDQVKGCQGNDASAYAIYYRGPFTIVDNDDGEDTTDPTAPRPTIYLPIIRK